MQYINGSFTSPLSSYFSLSDRRPGSSLWPSVWEPLLYVTQCRLKLCWVLRQEKDSPQNQRNSGTSNMS